MHENGKQRKHRRQWNSWSSNSGEQIEVSVLENVEICFGKFYISKIFHLYFFFFYSLGRSATIRLCNTFSIEKILLVMRHKQILSQGLIKGCSLVCCDTRSQDIVYTSADVHPVLQGNLYRVFRRYRDIQSDSDNRNGLAPDSLEFVQVHCPQ